MSDTDIKYTVAAEDRFGATFRRLKEDLGSLKEQSAGVLEGLGKVNVGLGLVAFGVAAGAAGLVAGIKNLAHDIDELNDASDATGESVEKLSALEDVARRNGDGLDLVTESVMKLNKALGDSDPNSGVSQALKSIGLNAAELRKVSPADAVQAVAVALQGYQNDGNKARVMQELFGKSTKDVAHYLNDLADAGKLNVTVTSEQSEAAHKFNNDLSEFETNASNAARSVASKLIPSINAMFDAVKNKGLGGSIWAALGFDDKFYDAKARYDLGKPVRALKSERDNLQEMLRADYTNADTPNRESRLKQIVEVELPAATAAYRSALAQLQQLYDGSAGAGRGLINPTLPKPSVGDFTGEKKPAPQQTEAERYLETLQKSNEKILLQTTYEQALKDIEMHRLQGITPAVEKQILAQARLNDQTKIAHDLRTAEIEGQSNAGKAAEAALAAMQKDNLELQKQVDVIGLTSSAQADLELARIRATIATKQQTIAEREAAGVGDERLQQLNAEIEAMQKRADLIVNKVQKEAGVQSVKDDLDAIGEHADDTLTRSISDGILQGFRNGHGLADVFLRELEAQFAKTVLQPIISPIADAGNQLIGSLLQAGASALFGNGFSINSTPGDFTGANLPDNIPTRGGRANGGDVRGGSVYRVNENGEETFEPNVDGVILNASQTRRRAQAAPNITYAPVVHVNGDVSAKTVQLVQAMLARNNEMLRRSMRTGGAYATN